MSVHYEQIHGNKLLRREGALGDVLDIFTTHRLYLPEASFFEQTFLPQFQKQPAEELPFLRVFKQEGSYVGSLFIPHTELNKSLENRVVTHAHEGASRYFGEKHCPRFVVNTSFGYIKRLCEEDGKYAAKALERLAKEYARDRHAYAVNGDYFGLGFIASLAAFIGAGIFRTPALLRLIPPVLVIAICYEVAENMARFKKRKEERTEITSGDWNEERLLNLYDFIQHRPETIRSSETSEALKSLATRPPRCEDGLFLTYQTKEYETLYALFRMAFRGEPLPSFLTPEQKRAFEESLVKKADEKIQTRVQQEAIIRPALEVIVEKKPQNVSDPAHYVGQVVDDYTLLECIGSGGIGVWYKAADKEGKVVAIKFPKEGQEKAFTHVPALLPVLKKAESECVVKVIGGNESYLVTEFLNCVSMRDLMRQQLPFEAAAYLVDQVAHALSHAHETLGITHNDVKPENVLVTPDGRVTLGDFDLAEEVQEGMLEQTLKTITATGTPAYMAPERLGKIKAPLGKHSDVYSLGVLFYELITGTTTIDRTPLQTYNSIIPNAIESSIDRMTAAYPAQRPALKEVLEVLKQVEKTKVVPKIIIEKEVSSQVQEKPTIPEVISLQNSSAEEKQVRPPLDVVLAQRVKEKPKKRLEYE